jgi:putative DNA primase/helicase
VSAAEVAAALGNARREGCNWRCICPLHGGHSLTLRDSRDGRLLVKCWAGCDAREVLAELRRVRLTGGGAPSAGHPTDDRRDRERRIEIARRIWDVARDARGTPVAEYLAGRGITIPLPSSLRWAPSLRRPDGAYAPAMVARVDGLDGDLIAVHRTYLERDASGIWSRRNRASLGLIGGGAVRLAPVRPDDWLVIGEGIETVASVMQCTGLPGWVALSASGIERLLLPPDARMVLIVADHDPNGIGERAAHNAARRWLREGRRVRIALPPHVGEDANDLLMGACSVAA